MINANNYYLVVRHEAVNASGVTESEIRKRLCSGQTETELAKDWHPGQPTTIEDDGRVRWTVTRSRQIAPDGKKRCAYVVAAVRYRNEQPQSRRGRFG